MPCRARGSAWAVRAPLRGVRAVRRPGAREGNEPGAPAAPHPEQHALLALLFRNLQPRPDIRGLRDCLTANLKDDITGLKALRSRRARRVHRHNLDPFVGRRKTKPKLRAAALKGVAPCCFVVRQNTELDRGCLRLTI